MTQILRVHKAKGFTTIQNQTIRDKRLSWKATGFLMFLLSCSETFKFNLHHLSSCKKDKASATRSAKDELVRNGYLKIIQIRVAGKIRKWEWHVFEEPISPDVDFQHLENPHIANPHVANQTLRNNKKRSNSFNKKLLPLLQESDLKISKVVPEIYKPQILERFSHLPTDQVQAGLDELAAAIVKRQINNPILWLESLFARGVVRTAEGIKKSEQRKAA